MINNENSLQFLKHSEVFETREDAIAYIDDFLRPEVLLAEPAVVFYGDSKKPNVILAIGNASRKVFLIDTAKLSEDIAEVAKVAEDNHQEVEYVNSLIKNIVEACGLDYDQNKKENQITYKGNVRDAVIGDATNLNEAIKLLSKYVQEHVSDNAVEVKETKTVELTYEEGKKGGKELAANVKISTEGDDDDLEFNDNVIGVKADGIFAAVSLKFDADNNRLIFTTSGMKNGKFVTDAKKQIVDLGEAPTAKSLAYKGSTVFKALDELEDNVETLQDLRVAVDANRNTLTIRVGKNSETVDLPGLDIVQDVKFENNKLIFYFKNGSSTVVPIDNFFKAYRFSPEGPIALIERAQEDGSSLIVGELKLRPEDNALAVDKDGYLFVPLSKTVGDYDALAEQVAAEIMRAKDAERELKNLIGDTERALSDTIKDTERSLSDSIREESVAREKADTDIINSIGIAVRDEADRAKAAESALQSAIDKEIADRREADIKSNADIVDARQYALDRVTEEADRAKAAEAKLTNDLIEERSRSEKTEIELKAEITAATTVANTASAEVATVKTDLQSEIDRAKEAENTLALSIQHNGEAVDKEIADRKEADAVQNAQIQAATDKLTLLDGAKDVPGSIRNISEEGNALVRQELANETERATGAESALGQRIDNIVTNNDATLQSAKDYTDNNLVPVTTKVASNEEKINAQATEITGIKESLDTKVGSVSLEKVGDNDLVYQLLVDGVPSGLINIPQDNFFKDASFDSESNILTLEFSTPEDGNKTVSIQMQALMQVYHSGAGLAMDGDNNLYINLNEAGEPYLAVDENGLRIVGINAKLNEKANADNVYTKLESDTEYANIRGEIATAKTALEAQISDHNITSTAKHDQIENNLANEIDRAKAREDAIDAKVETNRTAIEKSVDEVKGTVAGMAASVATNTDELHNEVTRATGEEARIEGLVNAAEAKIAIINGGVGTNGSVADIVNNAKTDLESKISAEASRAQEAESGINTALETAKADLEGKIADAKDDTKTYVDTQLNTLEGRVANAESEINTKIGSVVLRHPEDSQSYILVVDGVEVGTINTAQSGVLTDVQYLNGSLILTFLVDGQPKTQTIDLTKELQNIYNNGDAISIDKTTNTISVVKDGTSEDYLYITPSGVGVRGIDKAISDAVSGAVGTVNDRIGVVESSVADFNTRVALTEQTVANHTDGIAEAKEIANTAKDMATNLGSTVEIAQAGVDSAKADAKDAKDAAAAATTAANAASLAAAQAESKANDAKSTADGLQNSITQVQSIANTANSTAESAKTAADSAKATAESANTTATAAQTAVVTAQSTANAAQTAAATAQTAANTAQSTADTAKTNAQTAQSTADAAKSKAEVNEADIAELEQTVATQAETIAAQAQSIEALQTALAQAVAAAEAMETRVANLETELANRTEFGTYEV